MIEYTTGKSKDIILTCLITISGLFDLILTYIISFILNYIHLNDTFSVFCLLFLFLSVYYIFYHLFDKCFWNKKSILNHLNIYDLNGKWEGYTQTEEYGKKYVNVTIEQTWNEIDMNLKTNQSSSKLISFAFNKKPHDIIYTYQSEVNPNEKEINTHYGTCILDINENNEIMTGSYFTDGQRKTDGKIYLKRI